MQLLLLLLFLLQAAAKTKTTRSFTNVISIMLKHHSNRHSSSYDNDCIPRRGGVVEQHHFGLRGEAARSGNVQVKDIPLDQHS